jgi:elongator complex protein 1
MTSTFETITEILMTHSDVTQHINQVSVGWGRAETQFRGLRAKNAPRDPTLPVKVDSGVLSPGDDGLVRLDWRADGECLALSRVESEEGKLPRRVVRVYSREGQIESFSEPIDGLEGMLSWRPSGNWVATVQRTTENTLEIVFLERNGLRHGGFGLTLGGKLVRDVRWNSDSSILAVVWDDRIQLWTMSNYDWQLKQEIIRKVGDDCVMRWHPEKPYVFFASSNDIEKDSGLPWYAMDRHEYIPEVCRDGSSLPYDYGQVAVINGGIFTSEST